MSALIGRGLEQKILLDAFDKESSQMVAVFGRRRVGKTYLIKQTFAKLDFEFTGVLGGSTEIQLANFKKQLAFFSKKSEAVLKVNSWFEAFNELQKYLKTIKRKGKKIVFIDELPWLDTPKSNMISALGYFWNSYASFEDNVMFIICGSAASWMIKKIVNDRGGLHNRITKRLYVEPFTLHQTALFLKKRQINLDYYQIAQIYMVMGGIPHYLNEVKQGLSAIQNIDKICFDKKGLLHTEFVNLYASLFDNYSTHLLVVKALVSKWKGMTRLEILAHSKISDGGTLTNVLNELELSSFVAITYPYGKLKKDKLYRLCDFYSCFYLKFLHEKSYAGKNIFATLVTKPSYGVWSGYAFQNLCYAHINQIEKAIGIHAIYTQHGSYVGKPKANEVLSGFQIDMLISRADNIINICEIKYANAPYVLTKDYAEKLRTKMYGFKNSSKCNGHVLLVMITTYGIVPNMHTIGFVENSVILSQLFEA